MSKETTLEKYSEFEKEDAKRFASPRPLVITAVATSAAATFLYAFGGTEALSQVSNGPQNIIPIALINGTAAISFIRSVRKHRNLEKITKGIAREEERALLPSSGYELYRARRIIGLSDMISPSPFENRDIKARMLSLVQRAHKTADVIRGNKPLALPEKGSGTTIGNFMAQDHDAEVAQIIKTAIHLSIPRWAEYSKDYEVAGKEIDDARTIFNQNPTLE